MRKYFGIFIILIEKITILYDQILPQDNTSEIFTKILITVTLNVCKNTKKVIEVVIHYLKSQIFQNSIINFTQGTIKFHYSR